MAFKTISGTCEITTGAYTPTATAPVYQLENGATLLSVDLESGGSPYTLSATESAYVKFYFSSNNTETAKVLMAKTTGNISVELSQVLTAIAGQATAFVTVEDSGGNVLVSCEIPVPIKRTSGTAVTSYEHPADETIAEIYAAAGGALQTAIAPAYDATNTYALDAICTYLGKRYKCTTAITVAEAWTAGHWTAEPVQIALDKHANQLIATRIMGRYKDTPIPYANTTADGTRYVVTSGVLQTTTYAACRIAEFAVSFGERYKLTLSTVASTLSPYVIVLDDSDNVLYYAENGVAEGTSVERYVDIPDGATKMYVQHINYGSFSVQKFEYGATEYVRKIKGAALSNIPTLSLDGILASLERFQAINHGDTIEVCKPYHVATGTSTSMTIDAGWDEEKMASIVAKCLELGLTVWLKLHIVTDDGSIMATNDPGESNWTAWFTAWKSICVENADLCVTYGIKHLIITNELWYMCRDKTATRWNAVITYLHDHYSSISIGLATMKQGFDDCKQTMALADFVGFNYYPSVTDANESVTDTELLRKMCADKYHYDLLGMLEYIKDTLGVPVYLTEVGCCTTDYAFVDTWRSPGTYAIDFPSATYDETRQAQYYSAVLTELWNSCIDGLFLFQIGQIPSDGATAITFLYQNKDAENYVNDVFGGDE